MIPNDNAGVVPALLEHRGMKATKIGRIIRINDTALLGGPLQLLRVGITCQPALTAGRDTQAVLAKSIEQSVGVSILVQVDFDSAQASVEGFRSRPPQAARSSSR